MFFPTPSVTIALSFVKTSGSLVTASTAFFSHAWRKTNVSCPENEGLSVAVMLERLVAVVFSIYLETERQFQLTSVELIQKPLQGEANDRRLAYPAGLCCGIQAAVEGVFQIECNGHTRPLDLSARRRSLCRRFPHESELLRIMTRIGTRVKSPTNTTVS